MIGLLGGSFDPVHHGHLIVAQVAREALGLEALRFVPARQQPFKGGRHGASAEHRAAMFVAPEGATEEDLDARIPLSVARWHQHLDVCRGPEGEMKRRYRQATTASACEAAGGRFRSESRYMVHVMVDSGDDLAAAFPQHPDRD